MNQEAELVAQLQAGSIEAYHQLLNKHLPPINRYIVRMLGSANDAEDITQEVFLRLWQRSDRFNPHLAKLSTWLHQVAHNLCIDYFRKHKTDKYDQQHASAELTGGAEPHTILLQHRQSMNIVKALQQLPERQRSAITLCHYQGISNKAAAMILDISVEAVESLLSRARRKLREQLRS